MTSQSSRKLSMGSTFISEKRLSQWEDLMRNFSEKHKEQCKWTESLDIPRASRSEKYFPTGSKYEGTWDVLGMSGFGVYTFPNGVVYKGEFEDGMMHGKGELRYCNGAIIRGKWHKGVIVERTLLFSDALEYKEDHWNYCMMPDRRFEIEYKNGIRPAGNSYLTNDQPVKEIPPGFYDTGDGFYDPTGKVIYKYDDLTAIVRSPSAREQDWIVRVCRKSNMESVGASPDLYEEWSEPILEPELHPPQTVDEISPISSYGQSSWEQEFQFLSTMKYEDSPKKISTKARCYEKLLFNIRRSISGVFASQSGYHVSDPDTT